MSKQALIDLFAEDNAHVEFIRPVVKRIAHNTGMPVHVRIRSARGGRGKAVNEFSLYQKILKKSFPDIEPPDLIVVAVDCNCKGHTSMQRELKSVVDDAYKDRTVLCCPDPHIERWYLADMEAVRTAIGAGSRLPKRKCERALYKNLLAKTVTDAGHPPALGGIEFAEDIVGAMDFYTAGKNDASFHSFIRNFSATFKRVLGLCGA
jgi:hypothetical protein